tara:strand:+ start:125 stop:466 length:342 start_codon:yes stop_codon:yes gene_type:complete
MNKNGEAILFLGGILIVIILVKQIKLYIREERPNKSKGYGMPSTRSAIITFILFYLLFTYNYYIITKIILFVITGIIIYLKYYVKDHSALQLSMGSLLGFIISFIVVWFNVLL